MDNIIEDTNDKEQLFNDGIEILENKLKKWLKFIKFESNTFENNELKRYYIHLPRIQFNQNKKIEMIFPIYKLNTENDIELFVWNGINDELQEYYEKVNSSNITHKNINFFNYDSYRELVILFAQIFIYQKNLSKNEVNTVENSINNERLYELVEKYKCNISALKNREDNVNMNEKNDIEQANNDIEQANNENKVLDEYDVIINRLNNGNSEKKKYDFEWNNENKLRYISDKTLEIAYRMIEIGNISLSEKDNKITISIKIMNLCNKKNSTEELYTAVISKELSFNGENILVDKAVDFTWGKENVERVCEDCKFEKCPKMIAGYILYLLNNNLLKEYLEDRKKYREENEYNDYYNFVWNNEDGLKNVSEEIYNFAVALCDKGAIWTDRKLNKKQIQIYSYYKCIDYRNMNNNILEIDENEITKRKQEDEYVWLNRKTSSRLGVCTSYTCRLGGCPVIVAGYIQYLRVSGKTKQIEEDRKYYEEHKKEIDDKIQKELLEHIQKNKKNTDKFDNYKGDVKNISDLFDMIYNSYQKSLHCAVACKDKKEREEFIKRIREELEKENKIKHKCDGEFYTNISLQNFASRTLYFRTGYIYGKKGDTSVGTENNDVFILDKNNYKIKETDAVMNLEILKDHLYIIDGISEFIRDYNYVKTLNSNNIYRKQFERAIDFLTNLEDNNYLILEGTEQEIESLFSLDNRFKFAYRDSMFKIKEMSISDMFEKYSELLKPDLFETLRNEKDKYKKEFEKYLSLNKEFVPLSNREIVNYLATYCNTKDKLDMPENIYKKETVDEALGNIIGLENIKEKVKEFEKYVLFRVKAKSNDMKLSDFNMHMIFTGNPGTGKTTIARIMAKMLFDLGIIKENKLIEVERKDLVARYIGQTAIKTAEVIEKAKGGVLYIDEAYTLTPHSDNDFGAEAIATLIKAMEDHKDELVVIFTGYKDEMKTFIDSNPGIASRIGYKFDFADYTVEELKKMFYLKMKNMGFNIAEDVEIQINNICKYFYTKKNFGNARFIDRLIQAVLMKHSLDDEAVINEITLKDIPNIEELNNTNVNDTFNDTEKMLQDIIGMKELKEKIKDFASYVSFSKKAQNSNINLPNQNMHMIFTGNPGTGKTTVARIIAKMLFDMEVIHENKLVEVERKDLIAEYIGQTAPKTMEVIERAMGGVLFIDEAYSLASGSKNDFGGEAIATLIKAMEDHKGEFVVIFAGYKKEMKEFIEMNSGIASRIGYTFDFADYSAEELKDIYYKKVEKTGMNIDSEAEELILNIMKYFANVENIGNGRFVDRVFQETLLKCAKNKNEDIGRITQNDIPTIKEITNNLFGGKEMIDMDRINDESLRKTGIHEIGHATVRYILKKTPGIKIITINPEGRGTLGYVKYSNANGDYTSTKQELEDNIKISMAGMAAEKVFIGTFENGNTSDLEKATWIAKNMVTRYGMSDIGFAYIERIDGEMEKIVLDEVNKILKKAFEDAVEIIENNKIKMEKAIEYLMEHKDINEEEFIKAFNE